MSKNIPRLTDNQVDELERLLQELERAKQVNNQEQTNHILMQIEEMF
ncbi:MAG: hypothetical protein ABFC57_05750 [Veillonellales bacterium]